MRLAVLADIHGSLPALEAVLADMAGRSIGGVVNLGDCVSGPLWPAETLKLLQRHGWPTVRGNHDRQVAHGDTRGASDRFAWERLTEDERDWLGILPACLSLDGDILALHARPDHDDAYLLEDQVGGDLHRAAPATVAARLGPIRKRIVLTAHSHRAASLRLPDGRWLLNPGSVGCPAYDDDSTVPPHVSEAGSPSARYAVLDLTSAEPMIELFSIPYPHEAAARRAESGGRPDWAYALRTGFSHRAFA